MITLLEQWRATAYNEKADRGQLQKFWAQWDAIFTEEERKALYKEQKESGTIRKPKKIGRNDPCPCGSGKKYKHCCGR